MRTKWEYLIRSDLDQSEMAALGSEGWELVAVTRTESDPMANDPSAVMYFKRPVPDGSLHLPLTIPGGSQE